MTRVARPGILFHTPHTVSELQRVLSLNATVDGENEQAWYPCRAETCGWAAGRRQILERSPKSADFVKIWVSGLHRNMSEFWRLVSGKVEFLSGFHCAWVSLNEATLRSCRNCPFHGVLVAETLQNMWFAFFNPWSVQNKKPSCFPCRLVALKLRGES